MPLIDSSVSKACCSYLIHKFSLSLFNIFWLGDTVPIYLIIWAIVLKAHLFLTLLTSGTITF